MRLVVIVVGGIHPLDIGGRLTESEKIDPQAIDQSVQRMIGCNSGYLEAKLVRYLRCCWSDGEQRRRDFGAEDIDPRADGGATGKQHCVGSERCRLLIGRGDARLSAICGDDREVPALCGQATSQSRTRLLGLSEEHCSVAIGELGEESLGDLTPRYQVGGHRKLGCCGSSDSGNERPMFAQLL